MVVVMCLCLFLYDNYFNTDSNIDDTYQKANDILSERIKELERDITSRKELEQQHRDSIIILQNQLEISKIKQYKLKKQLRDAKHKIKYSNDSVNVVHYINYINQYRTNNN
ncbi:hypothetical protein HYO65_gp033 [Tenacibaculum phage PTm1]|uniref:Uncharacterized protein n=1 Tax=Tenacibaculum phage PTm1 TaxID=2547425 RepID=A0A5S9HX55_9CAUD|nr:hypothetical protein HYO65_gp033 [Tenacibaculum phage PTm1]BBI90425.1 hypothetical protein [Tenacibaculum phage PTm1]